jgi:DNA repair protein RecO (recombination protein O)
MHSEVKGLVLRTVDLKESDRLLTIFTEEQGIVTALAKGARSLKSRKMAATQQFCYSTFVLYEQGDKHWVKEASLIESFFGIRGSIDGLALAAYIVEVLIDVGVEDKEVDLLRLALNSLYAISSERYDLNKIKAVFEMRAMSILGFMPEVLECHTCARRDGSFYFDIMAGALECFECHKRSQASHTTLSEDHETHVVAMLTEGAKTAMCYAIYAPIEKMLSFNVSKEDMDLFNRAAEKYVVNHLERSYKALEFYNEVKR